MVLSVVQHMQAVAQVHDQAHVVIDDQDLRSPSSSRMRCKVGRNVSISASFSPAPGSSSSRNVRLGRQRPRDFHPSLFSLRQNALGQMAR